jgi:hypothetical protein
MMHVGDSSQWFTTAFWPHLWPFIYMVPHLACFIMESCSEYRLLVWYKCERNGFYSPLYHTTKHPMQDSVTQHAICSTKLMQHHRIHLQACQQSQLSISTFQF